MKIPVPGRFGWGLVLFLASLARGAILQVPEDFAGIQAAFDASAPGDTVLVERGTWPGLYVSPGHSLTLCSQYLFSQDSTDINETILDGQDAGTILDIVTDAQSTFILDGVTVARGRGTRVSQGANCDKGGGVNLEGVSNAVIRNTVFRDCQAPRSASVLNQGDVCGISSTGRLELRNIACYRNRLTNQTNASSGNIFIWAWTGTTIVDKCVIHCEPGSGTPLYCSFAEKDTMIYSNITIYNCETYSDVLGDVVSGGLAEFRNINLIGSGTERGATMELAVAHVEGTPGPVVVRNINVSGITPTDIFGLRIFTDEMVLDVDSVSFHHNRVLSTLYSGMVIRSGTHGTVRHLVLHDNVSGDSTSIVGRNLLHLERMDLLDAHIHDNRVILPADPNAPETGGHYVRGAMVQAWYGEARFENVVFENNRVDDLDNYALNSGFGYVPNFGRELEAYVMDRLTLKNLVVRHSRLDNPLPERMAGDGISLDGPAHALSVAATRLDVQDVLIEDCDDGGLAVGGDSVFVRNVVLRNVGRSALNVWNYTYPDMPPYYSFRNVLVDNVDASLNWLTPSQQHYSQQAVLHVGVVGNHDGVLPRVDFENVTVTGCDNLPHLFNFYQPADFRVRNCLFQGNDYDQLVRWNEPINQDWQYNLVQESVPGEGNLIGLDPRFDGRLGPPFLAVDSPCIDAGDPNTGYNDVEDPALPGFPLWPALGSLRNDIGFTGGPHAVALDTSYVSVPHWEPSTPKAFSLGAAYPNPFNPMTRIPFTLTRPELVKLSVHNLLGQEVAVLINGLKMAGRHEVVWEANSLASGRYLVTLEVDKRRETRAVTLLR